MVKKSIIVFLFGLLSFNGVAQNYDSFEELKENIVSKTIPLISVEELKQVERTKTLYIVLDAREKKEFDVSHINKAKYVGYENFNMNSLDEVDKETIIVVYCSVGYRSEKIGEKLKDKGFKKVLNLSGGVFDWVNKGNFVYDNNGEKTNKVHAYNKSWGKWLTKGDKVYE